MNVLDCFETICKSHASHTALITEDGSTAVTYQDLNHLATTLAEKLLPALDARISVMQDPAQNGRTSALQTPLVCIMQHRHIGLITTMLAVLKCGAAYVPVDPAFPPDRQTYIFDHSKCFLLICDEQCYNSALNLGVTIPATIIISPQGRVLMSTVVWPRATHSLDDMRALTRQRQDGGLMYVLYTSGSTGKPKGVMVKHHGVLNIVAWFSQQLVVNAKSRVLGLTTTCFDISVLEIYMPLISGATLVLADAASQKNPFRLLDIMTSLGITVFQATPTTYEMLIAAGWKGDPNIDLLVGGEAFRPSLLPLLGCCKSIRNVYGPTETTIWSSSYTLPMSIQALPVTGKESNISIPIGRPISATDFYLVNEEGSRYTLSPTEGELWIGGIGVAEGYLFAPDLTVARFVRNPFGLGTVYRTGDLVKLTKSGEYVFVRRLDDQVKVDGFRIELAEIENVYATHELVDQAVAIVRDNKLVIYLRAMGSKDLSSSQKRDIRNHASRSLTYYMLPKYTVMVQSFPQTANGKLDRNALPQHLECDEDNESSAWTEQDDHNYQATDDGAPRSMADHICDIVMAIKGKRPKHSANFTSIGVDSLGAVLFVRSLSDSLGGVTVDPAKIFAPHVTISSFATDIYTAVRDKNPEILKQLRLIDAVPSIEEGESCEVESAHSVESDFEDGLIANRRLFDGIRGVLTLMVFYDHYHPTNIHPVDALQSDTFLFVVLSGFTSAIQLREPPQRADKKHGGVEPRSLFDWKAYLIGRAFGIFPCLWAVLILNIPPWHETDTAYINSNIGLTHQQSLVCVPLYITALQSLVRPQCKQLGPNAIVYASLIWTVFILYSVLRLVLVRIQNYIMRWSTERESGVKKTWSGYVGDICTMVAYNRPCLSIAIAYTFAWLFVLTCVFLFLWRSWGWKNCLMYISYFVGGVVGASILESIHWALWSSHLTLHDWTQDDLFPSSITSPPSLPCCSNSLNIYIALAWRYFPDIIVLALCMLLSTEFSWTHQEARLITWIVLPILLIAYLVIASLQRGPARLNTSRWILESQFLQFFGYISYPMYLFQRVLLDYYAPALVPEVKLHTYNDSSLLTRGVWFVLVCTVCWLVQKYIQDGFAAWLYSIYIASTRKKGRWG